MERINDAEGRKRFILGPVEVALAGLIPTILCALLIGNWNSATDTIAKQGDALGEMSKQMASMSTQLSQLNTQLADLPSLRTRVTQMEGDVQRNKQDIAEIKAMRGLR